MLNWDLIIDEDALASVLPDEYARFVRPVREALALFLQGLPEHRQAAILREQAQLAATADISVRLALLAKSCPVLHKLGQVLARDRNLAPQLRDQLQKLESLPSSVELSTIEDILSDELGSLDGRGITLLPPAIAEASVAVVIGYEEQGSNGPKFGVFKLLKPGIEERLEQELELVNRVGEHLDQSCEELGIPSLDYQETFDQVREKLLCEVRLEQEQRNLTLAKSFYADDPRVHIPSVLEHCSDRVTAMEWLRGTKITDEGHRDVASSRSLATVAVEALIAQPVFSSSSDAIFHCDPHAGNLLFTDDGRLGILDWSLVGRLTDEERIALVQIILAAATLHPTNLIRALDGLAERVSNKSALLDVTERWIRQIRRGTPPGMNWLIGMMDEAVQVAGLRLGPDLLLFRKTLHTLDGVLYDLHADAGRLDNVLFSYFTQQFLAEWPLRWLALPFCRDFATRLSNFDLSRCMMQIPGTAARFWLGHTCDLLTAHRQVRCHCN